MEVEILRRESYGGITETDVRVTVELCVTEYNEFINKLEELIEEYRI